MIYKAFVIMPFSNDFNDTYKLGIKAAAQSCNVDAKRLDDDFFVTNMVEEIYRKIDEADFIIADMTGRNPNVFYEVGYAEAKNKLILLLTKNIQDIPFDFKQKLHIEYKDVSSLKENLIDKIEWAKKEVDKRNQTKLDVLFQISSSDIDRTEYHDIANVDYILEVTNLSDEPIEKLQMIDIITSGKWDFYYKEHIITSEEFSENNYQYKRHRFTPEEKIIPAHDHIQIKLSGKKTMWSSWDKTNQQDSYPLNGRVEIKVHVNNKQLSKKIDLNETATYNEIPF